MEKWSLSAEQARQYEDDGYFIVRNVIPKETAAELRGVSKNTDGPRLGNAVRRLQADDARQPERRNCDARPLPGQHSR